MFWLGFVIGVVATFSFLLAEHLLRPWWPSLVAWNAPRSDPVAINPEVADGKPAPIAKRPRRLDLRSALGRKIQMVLHPDTIEAA